MVLDNFVECAWVYSLTTKCFKYISPSVYDLRGLTVEEAMKETLEDSLTPESLQKIKNSSMKRYPRFLAGDRSKDVVTDVDDFDQYCKDGSIIPVEISTRLVFSEDTKSIDVVGLTRDITKRKQYEKELLEKLREKNTYMSESNTIANNNTTNIRIHFFKRFSVYSINSSESLKWSTAKNGELFAFLLVQGNKGINKDTILDNLWPDTSLDKATHYLHNTLYSMKKDLAQAGINFVSKFSNNQYSFFMPDHYSDLQLFNHILETTVLPYDSVDDYSATCFEQLLSIYEGDFLNYEGYHWASSISSSLNKQFKSSALSLSRYYFFKHDYDSTKRVLSQILSVDYYDETVHELLLKVHLQNHDYSAFLYHYSELESFLARECDIRPKNTIQNLYNKVYKDSKFISEEKTAHF